MPGQRLLQSKTRIVDPRNVLQATSWIPSGQIVASTLVKAEPALYGGVVVGVDWFAGPNPGLIYIWDSEDENHTDATDTLIGVVRIPVGVPITYSQRHLFAREPGIECRYGIWVEFVTGEAKAGGSAVWVIVYYK